MEKENYKIVFIAFNLDINCAESIYRYSPVFKINQNNSLYVLKKTRDSEEQANKLIQWTSTLKDSNIQVVTPVKLEVPNPQKINGEMWVVYPFIQGRVYNASPEDIFEAGKLLGRIHESGKDKRTLINEYKWSSYDDEFVQEVKEDLDVIREKYVNKEEEFENLFNKIEKIVSTNFEKLQFINLPYVDACWDYKANNLVYKKDGTPVLIDADSAGYIPRIFDLALALILFHTEMSSAPSRMFTRYEWAIFMKGYNTSIHLSYQEKIIWEEFLLFVFIDEALWAIMDLEEDETEKQKSFITSLLSFNPSEYKI